MVTQDMALRMLAHSLTVTKREMEQPSVVAYNCGLLAMDTNVIQQIERRLRQLSATGLVVEHVTHTVCGLTKKPKGTLRQFILTTEGQQVIKQRGARCLVVEPPRWMSSKQSKLPDWARSVAESALTVPSCTIIWNERKGSVTSGVAQWDKIITNYGERYRLPGRVITCTVGPTACMNARMALLLHEIAHHNVGVSAMHTERWQREVVRLYRKHGILEWVHTRDWASYACEKDAVARAVCRANAARSSKAGVSN